MTLDSSAVHGIRDHPQSRLHYLLFPMRSKNNPYDLRGSNNPATNTALPMYRMERYKRSFFLAFAYILALNQYDISALLSTTFVQWYNIYHHSDRV